MGVWGRGENQGRYGSKSRLCCAVMGDALLLIHRDRFPHLQNGDENSYISYSFLKALK